MAFTCHTNPPSLPLDRQEVACYTEPAFLKIKCGFEVYLMGILDILVWASQTRNRRLGTRRGSVVSALAGPGTFRPLFVHFTAARKNEEAGE